uniref:Uncharacterized protein n=1 Tax=Anguilla anguilla TaxID=7936 RepID=A0A0E9W3U6_ANGAN
MFWTSHCSWYCFPSSIGPMWFTALMETLSEGLYTVMLSSLAH